MLREQGFYVLEADAIARRLMEPGQVLFDRIVEQFGPEVVRPDGKLDRARLASLAFTAGRLAELNQIVHPPVIAEQERQIGAIFAEDPAAVAVVESALIFEAEKGGTGRGWRERFDHIVLVTAPDELKIHRYLARILPEDAPLTQRQTAEHDARARLSAQIPDAEKAAAADFIIDNSGTLPETRRQVEEMARELRRESSARGA